MRVARAYAKLNLALVVGPRRADGLHEVATLMQEIDLHDEIALEPSSELVVEGFAEDTLVHRALEALADAATPSHRWRVRIEKRIPVAAGLGGGSSDAAAALRLANATLVSPLPNGELHGLAARIGADVPFFLRGGTQLASGDGTALAPVALPTSYDVLLVLPHGARKRSTAAVYEAFDHRHGERGFAERRARLLRALAALRSVRDLAALPPNDLASSPLAADLARLGAFRADVTGAGPTVYGLFESGEEARRAAAALADVGATWLARPVAPCRGSAVAWQDGPALGRGQAVRQRVLVP